MDNSKADTSPRNPWDRQPDEPVGWFVRFDQHYRALGANRSLLAAYNAWRAEKGRKKATGAPDSWRNNAREWCWQERAEKWDLVERERARAIEQEMIAKRRQTRLELIQSLKDKLVQRIKEMSTLELNVSDMLKAVDLVCDLERQEDGVPVVLEHRGPAESGGAIRIKFEGNVDPNRLRLPEIEEE